MEFSGEIDNYAAVSPQACRAARELLGWTMAQLSERSQVHRDTIVRFEGGERVMARTVTSLQRALEDAGIEFEFDAANANGIAEKKLPDGWLVRLRP